MNSDLITAATFGYLEMLEAPGLGWTGGYLIVNAAGRPLEFHCTAPVAASRAQEILFGPTLLPFLLGEHLGATLVAKAKLKPKVLLVANRHAIEAGIQAKILSAWLAAEGETTDGLQPLEIATAAVGTNSTDSNAIATASELLSQLSATIDLSEPFERIREAIREAQRMSGSEQPVENGYERGERDAA